MKRIGILGGLFDPPHWGHLYTAQQILESKNYIDEVWFMPAYEHPWRKNVVSPADRVKMLFRAIDKRFYIDLTEINKKNKSYTIDTVRQLKKINPKDEFFWIIGADNLDSLQKWKNINQLSKEIRFLVFPRVGYEIDSVPSFCKSVSDKNLIISSLSSTKIRERIKKNQTIQGLVPQKVEQYILQNNLYE